MIYCDGKDWPISWWYFNCPGLSVEPKGFALTMIDSYNN